MAVEKNPIRGTEADAEQWEAFAAELGTEASVTYQNGEYAAYNALTRTATAATNVAKRIRERARRDEKGKDNG